MALPDQKLVEFEFIHNTKESKEQNIQDKTEREFSGYLFNLRQGVLFTVLKSKKFSKRSPKFEDWSRMLSTELPKANIISDIRFFIGYLIKNLTKLPNLKLNDLDQYVFWYSTIPAIFTYYQTEIGIIYAINFFSMIQNYKSPYLIHLMASAFLYTPRFLETFFYELSIILKFNKDCQSLDVLPAIKQAFQISSRQLNLLHIFILSTNRFIKIRKLFYYLIVEIGFQLYSSKYIQGKESSLRTIFNQFFGNKKESILTKKGQKLLIKEISLILSFK